VLPSGNRARPHQYQGAIFRQGTDGAKYVADEGGAYWLLDVIAIAHLYANSDFEEEFQVWTLKVREGRTASLICDDGDNNIVYTQHIEFTDFPLDEIKLYFTDNAIPRRRNTAGAGFRPHSFTKCFRRCWQRRALLGGLYQPN
jgi:hypothetical protein